MIIPFAPKLIYMVLSVCPIVKVRAYPAKTAEADPLLRLRGRLNQCVHKRLHEFFALFQ
jgi:hypothetical protein